MPSYEEMEEDLQNSFGVKGYAGTYTFRSPTQKPKQEEPVKKEVETAVAVTKILSDRESGVRVKRQYEATVTLEKVKDLVISYLKSIGKMDKDQDPKDLSVAVCNGDTGWPEFFSVTCKKEE